MDAAALVILCVSGFCATSAFSTDVYYFIRENKTWFEAHDYCVREHTDMAQIDNTENVTSLMNTPTGGYTDMAWIGLQGKTSFWYWVDEQESIYSNWKAGQPDDIDVKEVCVTMDNTGLWYDASCSEVKPFICINDTHMTSNTDTMTWVEAQASCERQRSNLPIIMNATENSDVLRTMQGTEMWIGLNRNKLWFWSTRQDTIFLNWKQEPDNLNVRNCATVSVKDGTWTDEQCSTKHPFFCSGIWKSRKRVVRMKIQSSANMGDPAVSANLLQQLRAAFTATSVKDLKLTWRK